MINNERKAQKTKKSSAMNTQYHFPNGAAHGFFHSIEFSSFFIQDGNRPRADAFQQCWREKVETCSTHSITVEYILAQLTWSDFKRGDAKTRKTNKNFRFIHQKSYALYLELLKNLLLGLFFASLVQKRHQKKTVGVAQRVGTKATTAVSTTLGTDSTTVSLIARSLVERFDIEPF